MLETANSHTTDANKLYERDRARILTYGDHSREEHRALEIELTQTMDRRLRQAVARKLRSDEDVREKVWELINEQEWAVKIPTETISLPDQNTPVAVPDLEALEACGQETYIQLHEKVLHEFLELVADDDEWIEARNQLVSMNLGIFSKVADNVIQKSRSEFDQSSNVQVEDFFDDFHAAGYEIALEKAYKYVWQYNIGFAYYIANWVLHQLQEELAKNRYPIEVSHTQQRRMRHVLGNLTLEEKERNQKVDPYEVAERCGDNITQAHVEEALEFHVDTVSIDAPAPGREEDDTKGLEACLLDVEDAEAEVSVLDSDQQLRQLIESVIEEGDLKPGDARVLLAYHGLDSPNEVDKSFAQIGVQEGYSAERARQRYRKALSHLRPVLRENEDIRQAFSDVVDFSG